MWPKFSFMGIIIILVNYCSFLVDVIEENAGTHQIKLCQSMAGK